MRTQAASCFPRGTQWILRVLQLLRADGMSSDESEREDNTKMMRYKIMLKAWRCPLVQELLNILNQVHQALAKGSSGQQGCGYTFCIHIHGSTEISTHAAVPSLPKDFYHATYLTGGHEFILLETEPLDKELSLQLEAQDREWAFTCTACTLLWLNFFFQMGQSRYAMLKSLSWNGLLNSVGQAHVFSCWRKEHFSYVVLSCLTRLRFWTCFRSINVPWKLERYPHFGSTPMFRKCSHAPSILFAFWILDVHTLWKLVHSLVMCTLGLYVECTCEKYVRSILTPFTWPDANTLAVVDCENIIYLGCICAKHGGGTDLKPRWHPCCRKRLNRFCYNLEPLIRTYLAWHIISVWNQLESWKLSISSLKGHWKDPKSNQKVGLSRIQTRIWLDAMQFSGKDDVQT